MQWIGLQRLPVSLSERHPDLLQTQGKSQTEEQRVTKSYFAGRLDQMTIVLLAHRSEKKKKLFGVPVSTSHTECEMPVSNSPTVATETRNHKTSVKMLEHN